MNKPTYLSIAEKIRENIASGAYALGRIPSERALIRQYSVSRATATKVLAMLEAEGLIVRRRGSGAFIRPAAESARCSYVSTLIADMDVREFFSSICGAIAKRARAFSLNFIWGAKTAFDELSRGGSISEHVAKCRRENIRGVFFVPQDEECVSDGGRRNAEIADTLRACGITVVLIDRDIVPFPRHSAFDLVGIDNVQAGYDQAKHLIECGCRRLVYVSHEKRVWTVDARFSGFRNALEECGLGSCEILRGDPRDDAFVRRVLRERPDGIAFVHDEMAIEFSRRYLASRKRPIAKFIGMDDTAPAKAMGISSLRQPAQFIGEEAARLMALRLGHDTVPPRRVLFSAELMPRASSLQRLGVG